MTGPYTDTQRMELRSYVNLAGDVVARLWPMRTFISRNPLQGLERLPFEEAVERGEFLFGARGYLAEEFYREAWRDGRITSRSLDSALQPRVDHQHKPIRLGTRRLSHLDVLRTALLHGISADDLPPSTGGRDDMQRLARLRPWAEVALPPQTIEAGTPPLLRPSPEEWPYRTMLAAWCDHTLQTRLVQPLHRQMIKWCSAFLDEGEAAWSMPHREDTFFRAWKSAAIYDWSLPLLGIRGAADAIRSLPDRPEDALLQSLDLLRIPTEARHDYLSLHLAALPGWAGFIKWRAEQPAHPWQNAYRIDLVKYLAVRLFYERVLVASACRRELGCDGNLESMTDYARRFPYALWFRQSLAAGRLPEQVAREAARLPRQQDATEASALNELGHRWYAAQDRQPRELVVTNHLHTLLRLADTLGIEDAQISETTPGDLATVLDWITRFPRRLQHLTWLEASELSAEQTLLNTLPKPPIDAGQERGLRPSAQFVFCIDVRSEGFRRHLEQAGGYDTFGFAGFFGLPISFRSLGEPHESDLCPVLLKPKHVVREVPRTYDRHAATRRKTMGHVVKAGHELWHDLKHNVVTPYVMVEAIGWFFALPLLGKTLLPRWYHRLTDWIRHALVPRVATTLTIDKLSTEEAHDMVTADQRLRLQRWLRDERRIEAAALTLPVLERIRLQALEWPSDTDTPGELARLLGLDQTQEATLLNALRRECRLGPRENSAWIERITRTGFTTTEQAYYVETTLRLMGFTSSFARLVFLCGHGSTSQNNPYESALDCGACGGSQGLPNARAFAVMANRPEVRTRLAARGIQIPADTHFVAAVHNTTTDRLSVEDLEDVPATHRNHLAQVVEDLDRAGAASAAERVRSLTHNPPAGNGAGNAVEERSLHWAEVRPEWGLARNAWFIIGRREVSRGCTLENRAFLHSYDSTLDPDGKLLEVIMTAPLVVAQWINAEYYFSTVAPDTYGSGSKVYHNVTGRVGVMTGNESDLRMGLPVQSVMDSARPYHEPLRLTAIIEAPPGRIADVIHRQPLLQTLFHNRWLRLIALDPHDRRFYRYAQQAGWDPIDDCPNLVGSDAAVHP